MLPAGVQQDPVLFVLLGIEHVVALLETKYSRLESVRVFLSSDLAESDSHKAGSLCHCEIMSKLSDWKNILPALKLLMRAVLSSQH